MNILITGAGGQIGSELTADLIRRFGAESVVCSDIDVKRLRGAQHREALDVTDRKALDEIISRHNISEIYHLAAILSGTGEKNPQLAYRVNMDGTYNVLEAAREHGISKVFSPSSIAVFGDGINRNHTDDDAPLRPATMYGVTKVSAERLFDYYRTRYDLDVRSLRFPGVISWKTDPGGGSTDYAVEIFRDALLHRNYRSFVSADTVLPFMYMDDVIGSITMLMDASAQALSRSTYNISGFSASCADIAAEVTRHVPDLKVEYEPDFRQEIVNNWPRFIDDSLARREWGWKPAYPLKETADQMILHLRQKLLSSDGGSGSKIKEAS